MVFLMQAHARVGMWSETALSNWKQSSLAITAFKSYTANQVLKFPQI